MQENKLLKDLKEKIVKIITLHPITVLTTLIGLILGMLLIIYGLWKVLLLCLFVMAGFIVGRLIERSS